MANKPNHPQHENDDFDRLAKSIRRPEPPPDLLGRCLSTVPTEGISAHAAQWLASQPVQGTNGAAANSMETNGAASGINGSRIDGGRNREEALDPERSAASDPLPATIPFAPAARQGNSAQHAAMRHWKLWSSAAASVALLLVSTWFFTANSNPTIITRPNDPVVQPTHDDSSADPAPVVPPVKVVRDDVAPRDSSSVQVVDNNQTNPPQPISPVQPRIPSLPEAPESPAERLTEFVDAGEFPPALAMAKRVKHIEIRDRWLAQIAVGQANTGDVRAALNTLSQVGDDRTRTNTLQQMGSMPVGGNRALGGGAEPDFDSLIQLMTSTVAPQSWDDVGGPGSVQPFNTGVYVDAAGELKRRLQKDDRGALRDIWEKAQLELGATDGNVHATAHLRKVSLTRLEKFAQLRRAAGLPLDESMLYLAGLQKVEYVLVYPETGDLVLAGPAGHWIHKADGNTVSAETGRPVLQLDDLIVLLRHYQQNKGGFGCKIIPRTKNLLRTQAFLKRSAQTPLKPGTRNAWLKEVRDTLGKQDIEALGTIEQNTRVYQVIVEADYHMKLVGVGLEEGTLKCPSYLDRLTVKKGEAAPPTDVLRWWFTLNYQSILANPGRSAFQLRGQGVQVHGRDVTVTGTGGLLDAAVQRSPHIQAFAHDFTTDFPALAEKYPLYADLQNVFDLAMVSSLIQQQGLADEVDWHQTFFGNPEYYQVARVAAPREVESVINHREFHGGKTIVAQVSGGVHIDTAKYVQASALKTDKIGQLGSTRDRSLPQDVPASSWWWD